MAVTPVFRLFAIAVALVGVLVAPGPALAAPTTARPLPIGLHVAGNRLVDGGGRTVTLHGVNRSGTEYACIQGWSIFDGPSDAASIRAMASWHINAVRVPLNEDCWLGINSSNTQYTGAAYRAAIKQYVARLHNAGLVAILDLHVAAPGTTQSTAILNMPDLDHAPAFWRSVATAFKADSSTVFDLYNEPHDISWTCWKSGGDCGLGYSVAGMQTLMNAVRATGATNPVMVGGLGWSSDLSSWLRYRPTDPTGNLVASFHTYNFSGCTTVTCWNTTVGRVATQYPVVAGEIGENDCAHGYIDTLMPWLDRHGAGYLGWGWDTYGCGSFPALISDYDGTPTAFGIGLKNHLASLS